MPPRLVWPSKCGCALPHNYANGLRLSPFCTSSQFRTVIPPESPRFIEIPKPIQPHAIRRPWLKGVLPMPRSVFTQKSRDQAKATTDYLASVTPEPLRAKSEKAHGHSKELVSWKERQSERRRQNLREGLIELHHRDTRTTRQMAERSSRRQARNLALRDAPEREDERLTRPSALSTSLPARHLRLSDSDQEARLMRKRENVARTQAMQEEERRDGLHTLYVNASNFITTEAQLDETINKVFDDQDQFDNDRLKGRNIWNLGPPESVRELLGNHSDGPNARALDYANESATVARERMKQIAEELTGGKMEDM